MVQQPATFFSLNNLRTQADLTVADLGSAHSGQRAFPAAAARPVHTGDEGARLPRLRLGLTGSLRRASRGTST